MYDTLLSVITSGDYQLSDIINKINTLWIVGNLTDDQRAELLGKAQEHLNVDTERPEYLVMLEALAARMTSAEQRISALEGNPNTDYPVWIPWDGLSSDYAKGSIVIHNDQLWESVYDGQNVWEPGAIGTEKLWVVYTEE